MATLSRGNKKLGNVLTFSRAPGATCPGASQKCSDICYAKKPYVQYPQSRAQWDANSAGDVPTIPQGAKILRLHVSGDFDRPAYVDRWTRLLRSRPDVTAWAYTRSWNVPKMIKSLERLRALPNVQLFASIDDTMKEEAPYGWRVAFIRGDDRYSGLTCPEQTGAKKNCLECGYCWRGQRGNVEFIEH